MPEFTSRVVFLPETHGFNGEVTFNIPADSLEEFEAKVRKAAATVLSATKRGNWLSAYKKDGDYK